MNKKEHDELMFDRKPRPAPRKYHKAVSSDKCSFRYSPTLCTEKFITFTTPEHAIQFEDLLVEAGYKKEKS